MPAVDRGTFLQLALLLLVVPAQYMLTQWKPTTSVQQNLEIQQLITSFHAWQGKLTNPDWWKQKGRNAWGTLSNFFDHFEKYGERMIYGGPLHDDDDDDPEGESPAIEVLKYRESNGYFGGSTEKRSPRPRHVKLRIGQVVRHKKMGYRGIVVGWDLSAQAPEQWLKDNIPPDKKHTLTHPYYAVLLDTRDIHVPGSYVVYESEEDLESMQFQTRHYIYQPNYILLVNSLDRQSFTTAYITQELLEGVTNIKVQHPRIDEYFEAFDGSRYLARPWLKKIYPHDQ